MAYYCTFNEKGWLLYESGNRPRYLNNIITSLDLSYINGEKMVRDQKVEYEIRGPIIHLSIGHQKKLSDLIDDLQEKNPRDSKKAEKGKNEKIRKWDDFGNEEELNYSTSSINDRGIAEVPKKNKNGLGVSVKSFIFDGLFGSKIKKTFSLFSGKIDVDELKEKMEIYLVKKNVDYKITQILVESVINKFKSENITSVTPHIFKEGLKEVLNKLIPSVDHELLLKKIRESKNVFSFCFIGVNGVGKSTSLAKICCWLLQNNLKVYIAACDTFRAGAVEQLKVHVERFRKSGYQVGFYEKGYSKDDSSVARTAIQTAQKEGYDAILIDTAGRMHNKKSLMDSLGKLIRINNPDHIIYVGEALVGGDSLDHIKEFNNSIRSSTENRKIDSILLTKVDTVDDKIGQIVNMTFSSHSPILFLGVGQTNADIKKINSEDIVSSLMS